MQFSSIAIGNKKHYNTFIMDAASTLLVVEDVPHILEMLRVTLTFKGYTVVTAKNGLEAWEHAIAQPPDLIITDILMPKLDGYALAYKLRSDPVTRIIPIIFLSATYVAPEDKAFALSLGAMCFLEKPVDIQEFLSIVEEVLHEDCRKAYPPMNQLAFYQGYRERLENKLRHKNQQIARTQRLTPTLDIDQAASFEILLDEIQNQRQEIQQGLDAIYRNLDALIL
jgi:CheY-like chemotaxis protein